MSVHVSEERADATPYPRVRRQANGQYTPKLYGGTQRPPQHADEVGAVCVIDLAFGGRIALHGIPGDKEWMRIEDLP